MLSIFLEMESALNFSASIVERLGCSLSSSISRLFKSSNCDCKLPIVAVWLALPQAEWRERYGGWKAVEKLEYVDALMRDAQAKPVTAKGRITI